MEVLWALIGVAVGAFLARVKTSRPKSSLPRPSMPGVEAIAAERRRQIMDEGYSADNDDGYVNGDLVFAAAAYLMAGKNGDRLWPWDPSFFKPRSRYPNMVRAGALIAAELDRLDRLNERVAVAAGAQRREEIALHGWKTFRLPDGLLQACISGRPNWTELPGTVFEHLDPAMRMRAMRLLWKKIGNAEMKVLSERRVADPLGWCYQDAWHFYGGMSVRNMLREHGFGEKEFGVVNLDDCYIELVEGAIALYENRF